MTHIVTADCSLCGACYDECPHEAVVPATPSYTIDPDYCDDCALCTDVCVESAIVTD